MRYKSQKISRNFYKIPRPKRRMSINVSDSFAICEHKGRYVVALCNEGFASGRTFQGNQTINRSQAIRLIDFLLYYINLVRPTEATELHASVKVSLNRAKKNSTELAALALNKDGSI